ncbi:terminase small subunit [Mycobacterium phage DrLupo]|uniref:Uncharacterized protein n=1 Tax=Mycobacterium phage DrLupo TaxID=2499037 RepID=A0A3S9UQG5_9CAUD|nr:terminase small subunit [Mycobacterium phage DrLupo]AZS12538.1 hypothetical protein SEA_DRLUPO_2 [Mycobacterium phage DrLupo]
MTERVEAPASLMGKPDGPHVEVPELGLEVPTYVDPREDLIHPNARGFKRLSHHIPFTMRGPYKPQWLPPKYFAMYGHNYITDAEGYVLCMGRRKDGGKCNKQAVNRTPYCPNHGGALHPADKKLSSLNVSIDKIEPERVENLDRVQKFLSGFLSVEELDDDEVLNGYVRNDDGRPIQSKHLHKRFQQEMTKELMARMQRFMQMKLPNMLKVLADLAESDFVEPADRFKAATWLAERVLGKVPDVVFHGSTEEPYERVLALASGSRDEFRKSVTSQRVTPTDPSVVDVEVVDDEADLEPTWDNEPDGAGVEVAAEQPSRSDVPDQRIPHRGNERGDSESDSAGVAVDGSGDSKSRADLAKEARERIKRAKTRRFAARSQGVITGEPAWLIEYKRLKKGGFKVILYPPEAQTQAVLDRIRDADLAQIGA